MSTNHIIYTRRTRSIEPNQMKIGGSVYNEKSACEMLNQWNYLIVFILTTS